MIEFMEKVVIQLILWSSLEEHYLLLVACKNVFGIRSASWCILSSIEYMEEGCVNMDCVTLIEDYHNKIEFELNKIYDGILKLFASHLPPSLTVPKSKVFYLKMKGDYYRYLAEFET
ncbi:14-3-3-like protein GF14 omega [Zea mays]|uniref:14-3-3-like protein GF14 omega n=1 Tax=Zea mays TaxID=4577 RepID=A0A1D6GJ76_MAIZE|nr:14-3-3-like protein GF14 omega [Zea mays]